MHRRWTRHDYDVRVDTDTKELMAGAIRHLHNDSDVTGETYTGIVFGRSYKLPHINE